MTRVTVPDILELKRSKQKIVCLTAYDDFGARMVDQSGAEILLVGDSLGSVIQGSANTTGVSLADVAYHVRCVRTGVRRALIVADLPMGSYGSSVAQAVDSSVQLVRAGACAVKIEGTYCDEIRAITKAGIPVMGHLGLTPQSVHVFGGHKVQGRSGPDKLIEQALQIQEAGVFGIVLELVTSSSAKSVSEELKVPTIGIGSGPHCDGQVQVLHDVLGMGVRQFKHAKVYVDCKSLVSQALQSYVSEVKSGEFPGEDNSF